MSNPTLRLANNYYNGKRTNMDYATAQRVARIAAGFGAEKPDEILEILGYPRAGTPDPFARISPEFSDTIRAAPNPPASPRRACTISGAALRS